MTNETRTHVPAATHAHENHSQLAHDVISAELVACTLGQRERLELRTDLEAVAQRFGRIVRAFSDAFRRAGYSVGQVPVVSAPGGDRTPDHPRVRRMLYR